MDDEHLVGKLALPAINCQDVVSAYMVELIELSTRVQLALEQLRSIIGVDSKSDELFSVVLEGSQNLQTLMKQYQVSENAKLRVDECKSLVQVMVDDITTSVNGIYLTGKLLNHSYSQNQFKPKQVDQLLSQILADASRLHDLFRQMQHLSKAQPGT